MKLAQLKVRHLENVLPVILVPFPVSHRALLHSPCNHLKQIQRAQQQQQQQVQPVVALEKE
jgi:hypothetical protein